MKKLILLLVIAVIAFKAYQHNSERKRQALTGKWSIERTVQGGWARLILNIKPEGDFLMTGEASVQGHPGFIQCAGDWQLLGGSVQFNFKSTDTPFYKLGKKYGGPIITLDEKTFSYKNEEGTETWSRFN